MTAKRVQPMREAEGIFHQVLACQPEERSKRLLQLCGNNHRLLHEVESLIRADADSASLVSPYAHTTDSDSRATTAASGEEVGDLIGPYKLLERIGEGGFGTVYLAEQTAPVRRKVAVKVIKLGMDTRQVIARFEAERQALAMMDHPHIAKVFDAGATATGRPYFVMELVKGLPITQYCDQHRIPLRERVALFTDVCNAVQHAHQKGIIHRDLKPSNVLVSQHDEKPMVKVIDFGIVKATGERLTEQTVHTEWRQLIGTPAYMSPEQAGLSDLDIDTRSDVYSLGVLLYELLTSSTPFDAERLRSAGYDEMRRIIREVEPPKPSTRLSSLVTAGSKGVREQGNKDVLTSDSSRPHDPSIPQSHARASGSDSSAATSIAASRHTDPPALARALRGELDWIAMKCLEKDRTRRYETASGLASDVKRYLKGEPVVAAPPSRIYRLSKTLRRHRTAAAVATGFVVLIAAGLVATGTLWRAESDQRARAEAINTFLKDMLTAADPAKARGAKLTVREALDTAAQRIEQGPIKDQPLVEAEIRFTIGSTYLKLGLFSEAEAQLRAADALQSRELGDEHPDTLRTRCKLADTLVEKTDYAEAALIAQPTMDAQSRVLGPDHLDTLQSMVVLGNALALIDRFAEAESLLRSAIERRRKVLGENHSETADAMDWLGCAYILNNYAEKAEQLHRDALRIHTQALGQEHPATLRSMSLLASSLGNQLRPEEAEPISRRALEPCLRVLGPDHVETLRVQSTLACSLHSQGRLAEAETIHRQCLAGHLRALGPTDRGTINTQRTLAGCLVMQQKYPEAETLLREALNVAREKYGPEHADTSIRVMCALASVLAKQRKDPEAEQVGRQVIELQLRQMPRGHPAELSQSSSALIEVLNRRGASNEALQVEQVLIESWLAAARAPDASADTLNGAAWRLLYTDSEQLRDPPQALELALRANERSNQQNPRHLRMLARAYLRTNDSNRAMQVWRQAISVSPNDQLRADMLNSAASELLNVTAAPLRNPAQALEFALRANELSTHKNPVYLDTQAKAYLLTGDSARAREAWEQASALLADDQARAQKLNGAAWQLLTVTPENLRDPAGALRLALRADKLSDSQNPDYLDSLALAYFRTGDVLKAIEFQKKALNLLPQDPSRRAPYEAQLTEFESAIQTDSANGRKP